MDTPTFVTDEKQEIAIRTDLVRAVFLKLEDDETVGYVHIRNANGDTTSWQIPEAQARQLIRRLPPAVGM